MDFSDVVKSFADALETGLPYAVGYLGIWLMFRVMRDFDLTVDGSFVTGASIAALLIVNGVDPWVALPAAFVAGAVGGLLTFALTALLRLPLILTSIIVGIGLFSLNIKLLGSPNVNLFGLPTVDSAFPGLDSLGAQGAGIVIYGAVFVVVGAALLLFLSSQVGLGLRAAGSNRIMAAAQGVSAAAMLALALALGNGLMGLSGALVAQSQGYADVNMGHGVILFGLTSIVLGEVFLRRPTPVLGILAVLIGTVLYRFLIALALRLGVDPDLYQGLTAVIVVAALALSLIGRTSRSQWRRLFRRTRDFGKALG